MHRASVRAALATLCIAALAPRDALANGRFPNANELLVHPTDKKTIIVRTTFGIITSTDAGKTFTWTCEPIIGFDPGIDPGVVVFGDGSIAVGSVHGLAVSHDQSCSFPFIGGDLTEQYVIDSALELNPMNAVALTATPITGETSFVQVFQTNNAGRTWSRAGVALPQDTIATTIEVAPSRPERLYVAGSFIAGGFRNAFVQGSDDRGATWGPRTVIPDTATVYLAAVDPLDPDRVYVRTYNLAAKDTLLVSTNGAKTFETALTITGRMTGFALSPDGSRIAVGGATDGILVGSRPDGGTGYTFEKHSSVPIECLRWTADALYACGLRNVGAPFVVGASTDEGTNFSPVLERLEDIVGPPACPSGTPSAEQCVPLWPAQHARFTNPSGISDAGSPPDAGSIAEPVAPLHQEADDGCGCHLRSGRPISIVGLISLILFALWRRSGPDRAGRRR